MFKRVDVKEKISGFSFIDKDKVECKVILGEDSDNLTTALVGVVEIKADNGEQRGGYDSIFIHIEDIPNLIKALQAAYDHKG